MRLPFSLFCIALFSGFAFGIVVWSQTASDSINGKAADFADRLVFASSDGRIYAFSAQSGTMSWAYDLGERTTFPAYKIDDNKVAAVGVKGKLAVINSNDGVQIANVNLLIEPTHFSAADGKLYIATKDGLSAYNFQGRRLWNLTQDGINQIGVGSGSVYFVAFGKLYSVSSQTGTVKWSAPASEVFLSRPVEHEGVVYLGGTSGRLYAFDAFSGSLRWSYNTGGWIASTPVADQSGIYFMSNDGYAYGISPGGQLLFNVPIKPSWAQPAIYQGKSGKVVAFANSDGRIYGLHALSGEVLWSFSAHGKAEDLLVHSGNIVFGTSKGKVYALSPSSTCSITHPENLASIGSWIVDVEGMASAESGIERVEVRASSPTQLGAWLPAYGKENWYIPIDFSAFESGPVILECRVRDLAGKADFQEYSSISIIKDENVPLMKMFVEHPLEVDLQEEFTLYVRDERGVELKALNISIDGVESKGDSPFKIKLAKRGINQISIEKSGFEPIVAQIKVRSGEDYSIFLLAAIAIAIAYFFGRRLLSKKK
ncbi:MAG: PQQ-binding-like beta-propeller repeat protein [Candidatus Anstonellaceae archaeon]